MPTNSDSAESEKRTSNVVKIRRRVQTAEGWKRSMEKIRQEKAKKRTKKST